MSHLLDVSLLLACAWSKHTDHLRANRWLNSISRFGTAPVIQMGFLRVSLSPAYAASFPDAQRALGQIIRMRSHRFVIDDVSAEALPAIASSKDVTDAHLVQLAANHRLKLATLDEALCKKNWAMGIAENPL